MTSRVKTVVASAVGVIALFGVAAGVTVLSPPPCQSVPREINRSGKVEVTEELQAVFDQATDCLRFPRTSRPARYLVDKIVVDGKADLRIYGSGATLVRTGHNDHAPFFEVRHSTNILVQNLRLRGVEKDCLDTVEESPAEEFEAGVQVMWSENVTINHVTAIRHSGDGAFVGWGTQPNGGWAHGQIPPGTITPENPNGVPVVVPKSYNIKILNSSFDCVARQGMALAWTDGLLVANNRLDRVALIGIDLEHFGVDNLTIQHNHFGRVRDWLFIGQVPGDNWYIGHNTSAEPIYMLIRYVKPKNVTIEHNTGGGIACGDYNTYGPCGPFLVATSGGEFRIIGNTQQFASHMTALDLIKPYRFNIPGTSLNVTGGVCNVYAQGNDFTGAQQLWDLPTELPPGCTWVVE